MPKATNIPATLNGLGRSLIVGSPKVGKYWAVTGAYRTRSIREDALLINRFNKNRANTENAVPVGCFVEICHKISTKKTTNHKVVMIGTRTHVDDLQNYTLGAHPSWRIRESGSTPCSPGGLIVPDYGTKKQEKIFKEFRQLLILLLISALKCCLFASNAATGTKND
uniref:Uncharacterized protein n=1 Tax=Anopheles culicifacies TaxID=139723 RepID=A0A182MN88_9DIPT